MRVVIGLLLAVGLILGSIATGSAPFSAFFDIPSVLVVIGGSIGAAFICFPLKSILSVPMVAKKVFLNKADNVPELDRTAGQPGRNRSSRRTAGPRSRLDEVENSFIRLGIQMAVDGTRPEVIEDIMRTEMDAVATRHRDGKSLMDRWDDSLRPTA